MDDKKTIKHMLNQLTCDEMDRAWNIFYKWGERTMEKRGVSVKRWKQRIKDNKRKRIKCEKYFPVISVEEGRAKFEEIIGRITERGYYSI